MPHATTTTTLPLPPAAATTTTTQTQNLKFTQEQDSTLASNPHTVEVGTPSVVVEATSQVLTTSKRRRKQQLEEMRRQSLNPEIYRKDRPLPSTTSEQVSIVSWNILADYYLSGHTSDLYGYAGEYGCWTYRKPLLLRLFAQFNADVLCVQEMQFSEYADFAAHLSTHGYQGVVQTVKGKGIGSHPVGLAVFFRQSKFKLIWQEHRSRCMAVGLETRAPVFGACRRLAVANVHLEGHWKKFDARFKQLKSLFTQLPKHPFDSFVLTGDFNSEMAGTLRQLLLEGSLEAGCEDHGVLVTDKQYTQPYQLANAYASHDHDSTFVMPGIYRSAPIDHVCFSRDSMTLVGLLEVMPEDQRADILAHFLPSRHNPSDHLAVGCTLAFRPSTPLASPSPPAQDE